MKISEAASGVGEEMADVGMAMQRAVDKTENMRARANAMDELEASGAFDDQLALSAGQDDIDRQLHELTSQRAGRRRPRADEGRARPGPAPPQALERRRAARKERARVIVRIATEGQYRLPTRTSTELNELDNEVVEAVDAGDEDALPRALRAAARARARRGHAARDDELEESDVILPPPDLTFDEAGGQFTGDGLIPG